MSDFGKKGPRRPYLEILENILPLSVPLCSPAAGTSVASHSPQVATPVACRELVEQGSELDHRTPTPSTCDTPLHVERVTRMEDTHTLSLVECAVLKPPSHANWTRACPSPTFCIHLGYLYPYSPDQLQFWLASTPRLHQYHPHRHNSPATYVARL